VERRIRGLSPQGRPFDGRSREWEKPSKTGVWRGETPPQG